MTDNEQIISALKRGGKPNKTAPPSAKQSPTTTGEAVIGTIDGMKAHELDDDYHKSVRGKGEHWGYHLLMDISDCNEHIDNVKSVENFLSELVKALDMKPIGKPIIVKVSGQDGRGVSGVQIITTSTITFHGDDDKWSAYIDVFSCKTFDPKVATDLIQKYFAPKKWGKFWIYRDAGRWPEK